MLKAGGVRVKCWVAEHGGVTLRSTRQIGGGKERSEGWGCGAGLERERTES